MGSHYGFDPRIFLLEQQFSSGLRPQHSVEEWKGTSAAASEQWGLLMNGLGVDVGVGAVIGLKILFF